MRRLGQLKERARTHLIGLSQIIESRLWHRYAGESRSDDRAILADLDSEGVHVTSLERLLQAPGPVRDALSKAATLVLTESWRERPALWSQATSSTDLRPEVLLTRLPELYLLGLDRRLLDLVEQYLGLPVAYHGAVLRHSLVDGASAGPRLWHQDGEDIHVFRVVIYVSHVTAGAGPFEYVPRALGIRYKDLGEAGAQLNDERMRAVVPARLWKQCLGPVGTVVLADTAQIFHHESLQTARDRTVVMIGYSSRRPKRVDYAMAHFPAERHAALLRQLVPPENFEHVFGWRRQAALMAPAPA